MEIFYNIASIDTLIQVHRIFSLGAVNKYYCNIDFESSVF